jgi:hypothetical protein
LICRRVEAAVVRSRIRRLKRQLKELEERSLRLDTAYYRLRNTRTLLCKRKDANKSTKRYEP